VLINEYSNYAYCSVGRNLVFAYNCRAGTKYMNCAIGIDRLPSPPPGVLVPSHRHPNMVFRKLIWLQKQHSCIYVVSPDT